MTKLKISIEQTGYQVDVGQIVGENISDATFSYSDDYIASARSIPISINLPLSRKNFTPEETRTYFEGLLPEGFTRRTVAQWMHADEADYLMILSALGKECLGALKVTDMNQNDSVPCSYEKLSLDQVKALAREGATKSAELVTKAHLSLTGASGKVGLYYDSSNTTWYLPKGSAPSTHIVKQSHVRLNSIVVNEQLSLMTAKALGIEVPDSFIINAGNAADSEVLFATQRYDRIIPAEPSYLDGIPIPLRLHQEDFAQALGIPSSAKYEKPGMHYLKDMFDLLRRCTSDPIANQLRLWDVTVFNYLLGNTDAHIKNSSLLHNESGKSVRLAPAYDIISTTVYESGTRDMAFSIGGEYSIDRIDRDSFRNAAKAIGLGERMAMQRFDRLADRFENALRQSAATLCEEGFLAAEDMQAKILQSGGYCNL